jgi:hypothetical protein
MRRRAGAEAALLGCLAFVVACALPGIGLFRGHLGTSVFQSYGDRTLAANIPYRDFSLEYPPGALPAFVVPSFGPAGDYDSWFMAFELVCGLACVTVVGLTTRSRLAASYCALAPLALGPLTLHRYDLWAAALATVGISAIATRRERLGFLALGAGAAAKIFPLALVPLALIHVGRRAWRGLAWFAGALVVIVGPFLVLGAGGVRFSVDRQVGRALQLETIGAAALLLAHEVGSYAPRVVFGRGSWNLAGGVPDALAGFLTALQIAGIVAVWALYARGPRTRERFLGAAAAAVAVWIVFGKVLSPQFLLWLVPLLALLRGRAAALLLLAVLGLTQAVYPSRYDALVGLQALPVWLLVARNALLLALAGLLVVDLDRKRVVEEVAAERERAETREPVGLERGERDRPDRVPGLEPRSRQ